MFQIPILTRKTVEIGKNINQFLEILFTYGTGLIFLFGIFFVLTIMTSL